METEILGTTWTLIGNNGAAEKDKGIPADSLSGKTSVKVTFDLHGKTFGSGHDEASLVFVQNGDWRVANLITKGGQNGLNGLQTITIPISGFHKVGNTAVTLDPTQPVSNLQPGFGRPGVLRLILRASNSLVQAVGIHRPIHPGQPRHRRQRQRLPQQPPRPQHQRLPAAGLKF
jgi:hypothetical protein